jgi:hypothetical protein
MCNSATHSAGCSCGFGPPYGGRISTVGKTEWVAEAAARPELIPSSLATMGWDAPAIASFVEEYNAVGRGSLPDNTLTHRLTELLGKRRQVLISSAEAFMKVSLYRFAAPSVPGSEVAYKEANSQADKAGWNLKVLGIGVAPSTELQVEQTSTFLAAAGTCKQVFVKVKMRIDRIAVYEGIRKVGEGFRGEVVTPKRSPDMCIRGRGCESVRPEDFLPDPGNFIPLEYLLSDDKSGAIHADERSWSVDVAKEVTVAIAGHINLGTLVHVKRLRKLTLALKLPSGRDYLGHLGRTALSWERDAK